MRRGRARVHPGSRPRRVWQHVHRAASRLYVRRCRRYFREPRPDLLHVFTPDAGAVLMIRAGHDLGIPVLYHEMGTPHYLPALDGYYRQLAEALPPEAMRRIARDPALRASMGRAARARYLKLFPADAVLPLVRSTYLRVAGMRAERRLRCRGADAR